MDRNSPYFQQVQLLVQVLPFVFQEPCFALKGGTAINLFVRDFPRLSVDIDLVYLPDADREQALVDIHEALNRIAEAIQQALGTSVTRNYEQKPDALRLLVTRGGATIKIELSPVLRGTVYPPVTREVVEQVEDEFGFAEAPVVALEDLYAGKICAALDRQHPRDFFDVKLLLEQEGITDDLRKAFIVYLVSHPRPMEEMLAPNWQPLDLLYEGEFKGMAFKEVSLEELYRAAREVLDTLLAQLTDDEKRFLCSIYEGSPDWRALGLAGVSGLPAVQWKLNNVARMPEAKRKAAGVALRQVLDI